MNITGDGSVSMREIAQIMGLPMVKVPERVLRAGINAAWRIGMSELAPGEIGGLLYMPIVDTTRLQRDWEFTCQWSSRAALCDMARAAHGLVTLGKRTVTLPWRVNPGSSRQGARCRHHRASRTFASHGRMS